MSKFDWEQVRLKIESEYLYFNPPIVLDCCIDTISTNLTIYQISQNLYAETNAGTIFLPSIIKDEDDFYTIEDIITDQLSF